MRAANAVSLLGIIRIHHIIIMLFRAIMQIRLLDPHIKTILAITISSPLYYVTRHNQGTHRLTLSIKVSSKRVAWFHA